MNIFDNPVFNNLLYQPLFNALILLYGYLPGHDFGIAVIILTILIRLLLHPLMAGSIKSQKALAGLQPKIQEIQEKFKSDQKKQAEELMLLYKKEKINPFAGFLSLFIQLPLLIALYRVFWKGLQFQEIPQLYSFIPYPEIFNTTFLGIINLSEANTVLAVIAAVIQFIQMKTLTSSTKNLNKKGKTNQFLEVFQKQTVFFIPFITFFFLLKLPAAIALYWTTTSLFSIGQQKFLNNHDKSS